MLAIIKCVAHQKTNSLIAKGNNLADEAAKRIATPTCIGPLLVAGDCEPPSHGLWRSAHGHIVLPTSLVQVATRSAHGQDHCTSGEVLRRLQAVWWSPFFRPAFVAETILQGRFFSVALVFQV